VTRFEYDTRGNPTTVTRLDGTPDAVTTSFRYHGHLCAGDERHGPALTHTTTYAYAYDTQGRLVSVTDPLSHQTTVVPNAAGQPAAVTTP
jgi:YD repeat-containing protein